MPDVIEQLRAYGEAVEGLVPEAAAPSPEHHPRRPLVALAAVVLVVACVAAAVVALRARDQATGPAGEGEPTVGSSAPTGWARLTSDPLAPRDGAALVWTGDVLVAWGGWEVTDGAAYDPDQGTWRPMSPSPLGAGRAVGVWTGDEVLLWTVPDAGTGRWQGAAWDPRTDTWRSLTPGPHLTGAYVYEPVWTGHEVIDATLDAAYDPATDRWRQLPPLALTGTVLAATWTGEEVVAVAGGGQVAAYSPATDSWRSLPPLPTSTTAPDLVWDGDELVLVDYDMHAARYRPGDGAWREIGEVPLRFYECGTSVAVVDGTVISSHCSGYGVLRDDGTWAVGPPPSATGLTLTSAGDEVLGMGSSGVLRSYRPPSRTDSVALESTLPVGTVLLDLPDAARVLSADRREEGDGLVLRIGFEVDLQTAVCGVESVYDGSMATSDTQIRNRVHGLQAQFHHVRLHGVEDGRDRALVATVPAGELDDRAHVLLEETTTDVLDIACLDLADAEALLARIHR